MENRKSTTFNPIAGIPIKEVINLIERATGNRLSEHQKYTAIVTLANNLTSIRDKGIGMERVIQFKLQAIMNPKTYVAMVNDKVVSWSRIGPDNEFVQIHDSTSDDFPSLRRELSVQNQAYDFYQQRMNEGDHTVWRHGRNGGSEIVSNFGNSDEPYAPLYECD